MRKLKTRIRSALLRLGQLITGHRLQHLDLQKNLDSGIITIGRRTISNAQVHHRDGDGSRVIVGAFSGIAESHLFTGSEHRIDWITTYPLRARMGLPNAAEDGPYSKGDIVIGSDVWVGYGAIIVSGVTIGNGAVVGAGAVVTKDVRPYAIVVGNPAREIRRRFTDDEVDALQRIAWWDWSDEKIAENADLICSDDVTGFISKHG